VLGVAGLALLTWVKASPPPADADFAGSGACVECHRKISAAWRDSQHNKMMRPADAPGVVVADLTHEDVAAHFDVRDIVWAIGGKWEQQFMGEDEHGETLLPGAWMHLSQDWLFQGWDGWEVPVPRRRCHGCHTVGLDAETGKFVEPNIACEACHGPSSWHVDTWGFGRTTSTADADVCGQCHTRGKDPSGEYFFPVGFRPGDRVEDFFVALEPTPGQSSSQWWGNGHARDRHQEFTAWSQGGHANSLRSLREGYDGRFGPADDSCLRCHAAEPILQPWLEVTLETAREPVTCSVCHNVHGSLDEARMVCGDCHGGAGSAFYHTPEQNAAHVPCPESAGVDCADCHMPKTGHVGGAYALHSHSPGIVSPREAARYEMPSSCQNGGCHADDPVEHFDPYFHGFEERVARLD